jgi:uncharacterized membrane protein YbhN (UPF0104 family)
VQVSEPFVKKVSSPKFFSILVKVGVFLLSVALILYILWDKKKWVLFIEPYFNSAHSYYVIGLLIFLMLLNISVEALKWFFLVKENTAITFFQSLKAIFSGTAAGLITPHGIGDYVGRILFLDPEKRLENIGSVFFSRIAQMCITCITGFGALVFIGLHLEFNKWIALSMILACAFLWIFTATWYKRTGILDGMKKIPLIGKIENWFENIRSYSNQIFVKTLVLSGLRYGIFLTQFVILLVFFDVQVPLSVLVVGGIFIFFVKSIIPTFLDLGVRELAAVFFFANYHVQEQHVLAASLSLWVINIIIPSFIGLIMMFQIEYVKKNKC